MHRKSPVAFLQSGFVVVKNPAIPTFALVGTIIGSESLTTVFGMGTGGPFGYGHRERITGAVAHCDPNDHDTFWIGKCNTLCSTIQYRPDITAIAALSRKTVSDSTQPFAELHL